MFIGFNTLKVNYIAGYERGWHCDESAHVFQSFLQLCRGYGVLSFSLLFWFLNKSFDLVDFDDHAKPSFWTYKMAAVLVAILLYLPISK